jgi:hypothetical protein
VGPPKQNIWGRWGVTSTTSLELQATYGAHTMTG